LVALLFGLQSYRYHQLVACVPLTGPRPSMASNPSLQILTTRIWKRRP
jgi:hypothetical protein